MRYHLGLMLPKTDITTQNSPIQNEKKISPLQDKSDGIAKSIIRKCTLYDLFLTFLAFASPFPEKPTLELDKIGLLAKTHATDYINLLEVERQDFDPKVIQKIQSIKDVMGVREVVFLDHFHT